MISNTPEKSEAAWGARLASVGKEGEIRQMDAFALEPILGKSEAQLAFPAEHADQKSNDLGRLPSKRSLRLQSDCVGSAEGMSKRGACGRRRDVGTG